LALLKSSRAVAAEMFSSGTCPLNCSYCYIPKNSRMRGLHKKIIEQLDSGEYIQRLKNFYGEKLTYLGFWGTEPTLTFDHIAPKVPELLTVFPNLKKFSWSSNFILDPQPMVSFLKAFPKQRYEFNIQVSVDGPASFTDVNRGKGSTDKIVKNIVKFLDSLKEANLDHLSVTFVSKPTWDIGILEMVEKISNILDEYFGFFVDLNQHIKGHVPKYVMARLLAIPTLVVPGMYTQANGVTWSNVTRLLLEYGARPRDAEQAAIIGNGHSYLSRLQELFVGSRLSYISRTCSGGKSNFAIDDEGQVNLCHRSFFLADDEYVKKVYTSSAPLDGVSTFDPASIALLRKYFMASDPLSIDRMLYVTGNYHDFRKHRIAIAYAFIKELALGGQVSERYLADEFLTGAFAVFANAGLGCPIENIINTGNIHVQPFSLLRLFGNGAFEQLLQFHLSHCRKN